MGKHLLKINNRSIIQRHLSGKNLYDIAKEENCSYITIQRWFKRNHIKPLHLHKNSTIPFLNISQLSYLAGIFDGEGWVGKEGNSWRIIITNTNLNLIKYLKNIIPQGTIITKESSNPKHSTQYHWSLAKQFSVLQFLKEILPYLIIKKEKSEQAIKEIQRKIMSSIPEWF